MFMSAGLEVVGSTIEGTGSVHGLILLLADVSAVELKDPEGMLSLVSAVTVVFVDSGIYDSRAIVPGDSLVN